MNVIIWCYNTLIHARINSNRQSIIHNNNIILTLYINAGPDGTTIGLSVVFVLIFLWALAATATCIILCYCLCYTNRLIG